jgi:hypothetical protein
VASQGDTVPSMAWGAPVAWVTVLRGGPTTRSSNEKCVRQPERTIAVVSHNACTLSAATE